MHTQRYGIAVDRSPVSHRLLQQLRKLFGQKGTIRGRDPRAQLCQQHAIAAGRAQRCHDALSERAHRRRSGGRLLLSGQHERGDPFGTLQSKGHALHLTHGHEQRAPAGPQRPRDATRELRQVHLQERPPLQYPNHCLRKRRQPAEAVWSEWRHGPGWRLHNSSAGRRGNCSGSRLPLTDRDRPLGRCVLCWQEVRTQRTASVARHLKHAVVVAAPPRQPGEKELLPAAGSGHVVGVAHHHHELRETGEHHVGAALVLCEAQACELFADERSHGGHKHDLRFLSSVGGWCGVDVRG